MSTKMIFERFTEDGAFVPMTVTEDGRYKPMTISEHFNGVTKKRERELKIKEMDKFLWVAKINLKSSLVTIAEDYRTPLKVDSPVTVKMTGFARQGTTPNYYYHFELFRESAHYSHCWLLVHRDVEETKLNEMIRQRIELEVPTGCKVIHGYYRKPSYYYLLSLDDKTSEDSFKSF